MPTPEARRMNHRMILLVASQSTVSLILIIIVFALAYVGRVELHDSQLAGCERGKLDRADNAAGWTAHAKYIRGVTGAASVQEDVKVAAREAVFTYERISEDLTRRSRIDCDSAFPAPSLIP